MPLEFLRRKGGESHASKAAAPVATARAPVPEEAVAQEHQLRLTFGAKTSNGVRLQGGPHILAALPAMLDDIGITPTEVVQPRETTLAAASPGSSGPTRRPSGFAPTATTRRSRATRCSSSSRSTRSTPPTRRSRARCSTGSTDSAGYPDFSAIVGGVAAHWDEATGDLIVRAIVAWGGRGTRGDTDREASRSWRAVPEHPRERPRPGRVDTGPAHHRCRAGRWSLPLRLRLARARVYCPKCGMRMLRS